MLASFLPANVFSEGEEHQIIQELLQESNESKQYEKESKQKEFKLVGEDISKRDKNVKHFLREDMTYEAVIYPFAVHYEDEGEWKDIDNTLIEAIDDEKNKVLKNKSNDFQVKVSKNINSEKNGHNN